MQIQGLSCLNGFRRLWIREQSVRSRIHQALVEREVPGVLRSGGAFQIPSGGGGRIIEWEETLDAQFLERDVLWGAEYRDSRKEVKRLIAMPKAHRYHRDQGRSEVRRPPVRRDVGVAEHLRQQLPPRLLERTTNRFAMHAMDECVSHGVPVFDRRP